WVLNADDPEVMGMGFDVSGTTRTFATARRADAWLDRDRAALMLDGRILMPREDLALLGDHNVANALAASLAAQAAGLSPAGIREGLDTFRALAHRLEPVREVGEVLWINDSKATNIAATRMALRAMTRPFVLLLGGRHKGEPYTALADDLEHCRVVIAYGEARAMIEHDLDQLVPVSGMETFEEVMDQARSLARPGDGVLLSPACSSFDMFRNYEERGATFRRLVEAM
ncbi:MAG: glutamate ligase domain-containing protein, partial [Gemmatimonadales bacterium]